MDDRGCGSVEEAGFPFAPLIAALAPIVIPGAIKAAKNLINNFKNKSKGNYVDPAGRLYMGRGEESDESLDNGVSRADTPQDVDYNDVSEKDDVSDDVSEEVIESNKSGYIPTNPNITNLKKLQHLYESHV